MSDVPSGDAGIDADGVNDTGTGAPEDKSPHWSKRLRRLKNDDIRGPYASDDNSDLQATLSARPRDTAGGRRPASWIWTLRGAGEEPTEQVRVHWTKMISYAERWEEELTMLPEEMRRTFAYFEWEAKWWRKQAARRRVEQPLLASALHAYAYRQAAIREKRIASFAQIWIPLLERHTDRLDSDWISPYQGLVDRELLAKTQHRAQARKANQAKKRAGTNKAPTRVRAPGIITSNPIIGEYIGSSLVFIRLTAFHR
jgi:hypothetical protein